MSMKFFQMKPTGAVKPPPPPSPPPIRGVQKLTRRNVIDMKSICSTTWKTADEIRFIRNIGQHTDNGVRKGLPYRIRLLKNYIRSIPHRHNWEGMDKEEITRVAAEELQILRNSDGRE